MPTSGELIAKYIEIRDTVALLEAGHKDKLKPYKAAMEAIENALLAEMQEDNITQIKCEFGTAFQKKWMATKTVDKELLMAYVRDFNRFDLLTAAVSKEAVREHLEKTNDVPPPGVDVTFGIEIQVRRPS